MRYAALIVLALMLTACGCPAAHPVTIPATHSADWNAGYKAGMTIWSWVATNNPGDKNPKDVTLVNWCDQTLPETNLEPPTLSVQWQAGFAAGCYDG